MRQIQDPSAAAFLRDRAGATPECWQRVVRTVDGRRNDVAFSPDRGDGSERLHLGEDSASTAVSGVSLGNVLPWNLSGVPGAPAAQCGRPASRTPPGCREKSRAGRRGPDARARRGGDEA